MTHLSDVFDLELFARMREQRMVNVQTHPQQPLLILNYADTAQYTQTWNPVTLACRGLIVHADTHEVIARPFGKFFNHGEKHAPTDLSGPVHVTDKLDGSLGILYRDLDGQYAVATRGSFASDQARHATAVYRARYDGAWQPNPDWTYLFEIVYPTNRIVVNYGDADDLLLLGAIETATGRTAPFQKVAADWPGPVVEQFDYATIADALAAPARANREGFVVHLLETDERVKIKYDEYKRLHRILTGCSARTLWEHLAVDACKGFIKDRRHWGSFLGMDPARAEECLSLGERWLDTILADVPDEFYSWVKSTITELEDEVGASIAAGRAEAARVWEAAGQDRQTAYQLLTGNVLQMELMRLITGGKEAPLIMRAWREADPGHSLAFWSDNNGVEG